MPACHGHSLTSTSWPPTILVALWARPQMQSSEEPVPLPPVGGMPDPDPDGPVPDPGKPDPDPVPVGGIGGIPEPPPVPMSLGMWTQTHPEWLYPPPGIPEPPGIPDPDPPGIPEPEPPPVPPVEPPTAVTLPILTLPFLTLNPKVYE